MRQINLFSSMDENQTVKAAGRLTVRNGTADKYWIAVASADHVDRGRREGFMQVCHGKANPLRRLKAGDGVIYYSPTCEFGSRASLQAFTAIGTVAGDTIEQRDMGDGFRPFRRSVNWRQSLTVPIRNILDQLEFTSGKRNWGYQFRFGLFEASEHDFRIMENVMIPAT